MIFADKNLYFFLLKCIANRFTEKFQFLMMVINPSNAELNPIC